mmetsp:Transcript_20095/g.33704  ORF Transcript_20095/g.33704 Transcript_20095/m.33704 type:complete len:443 (+) Transcript_20095:79-1407(+)
MATQMAYIGQISTKCVPSAHFRATRPTGGRRAIPLAMGLGRALPLRTQPALRRAHVARAGPVAVTASLGPEMHDMAQQVYTLAEAAVAVADAEVVEKGGGFLAPVVGVLEAVLKIIDSGFEAAGLPYSYGFSIIALTLLVKLLTFPLSKQQVESTMAMQTLQPRIKDLQKQFAYDKERLQMETARLYQDAGVNPLAGCLPTLATLPVWIGLYRALTNVADEGLLTDGFFWIPSLAGPSSLASRDGGTGLNWLMPLVDGHPPIGWHDAAAYLVMPVLLIVSQYVSQAIISPPKTSEDPAQGQTQAILKFLPLMIGWFSLNVPSGLTLYWFTNNILTTGQQVYLRNTTKPKEIPVKTAQGGGVVVDVKAAPLGGPGAPTDMSAITGETRSQRRDRERQETRGERFAARKSSDKGKKGKQTGGTEVAQLVEAEIVGEKDDKHSSS